MKGEKHKEVKSSQVLTSGPSKLTSNIVLVMISLYLLVDCVPAMEIQDQMGIHWLLIAILNLISACYIFRNEDFNAALKPVFKNSITWLYLAFIIISGLSIFVAINKVESLVIYARLLTVATAFFIFGLFLYKRNNLLKNIGFIVTLIVLAQSFSAVMQFYSGVGKVNLSILINNIQSTAGNKNIFAAALVIKIPIIIYCLIKRDGFVKYLSALSLLLAVLTVFLINARSAYLGLIISLLVLVCGLAYLQIKSKEIKQFKFNSILLFGVYAFAFFISQNAINKALKSDNTSVYGTFTNRLTTITDQNNDATSIRLKYWKETANFISKRPLTGVGYGNWKLYSPLYTRTLLDDNVFSKHPHNDFLEIAGETGIPNSLIYLSIFLLALIFTIKIVFSKHDFDKKMMAIVIFASLSGYFIDAFFNFPSERPNIQILLALLLAFIITNSISDKETGESISKSNFNKIFGVSALLISVIVVYAHFTVLKSMKAQFVVDNDLNSVDNIPNAMPKLKFAEVNQMFPSFPNIAENSETIAYKKAKYLQKEKRFDEAIKLLDNMHDVSPNIVYDTYLKCNIYTEMGKIDSATKYSKLAFYLKPRHFYYYRMASYYAGLKKDSAEVINMFKLYNTYRKDEQSYSYYAQSLKLAGYNDAPLRKIVDQGLKLYPKDQALLNISASIKK
ncbi:O-antigen ligase family protein [Pedobacter punctiformis]|uniref:O-antigen ligase family protein n=1 Tax=Pedobacter punctiformis TaxID=3004097 RepID=A0ABT4L4L0_9SPHI|nr:O-antigen ligase family protein [Pedobacter sp. HCMS5-2]MCZ4242856.1 O-antigen ligase family protein [Pedobacter sp. HCMS5-2]